VPTANSLNQLASSLTQWRGMLPREIQWAEDDPAAFPVPQPPGSYNQPLDPNLAQQQVQSGIPLFSADLDNEPVHYPYAFDIQVALLRTRYYYAKHMVYRPFIYKALHFPEQMTQEDAQGAAECLRVSLKLLFFNPYTIEWMMSLMKSKFEAYPGPKLTHASLFIIVPPLEEH
jgi:hypothetical protein